MQVRREEPSPAEAAIVASRAFGVRLTPEYEESVASVVTKGQYYAARDGEKLIGFLVVRPYGDLNYIDGTAILPEHQGQSVAHQLGLAALADFPACFVAMLTQSVHTYSSVAELCSLTFPAVGQTDRRLPDELEAPAQTLISHELRTFPIVRSFYPPDFYGEKPVSRDSGMQSWWDSLADFGQGDAIYVIGKLADGILQKALNAGTCTVERPHNPLVRIFRTSGTFFPERVPNVTFEVISYSGVYSHKGWENRLATLSRECRSITEALYREFPELHMVFFAREHVTCEMSPGYAWTEEKESRILKLLAS